MTKVLLTGAAGRIGTLFLRETHDRYDYLLTDLHQPEETYGHPFVAANLTELAAMIDLCQGVETVLHLGADHRMSAGWDTLLPSNVIGVYNLFEAAAQTGVKRVVWASSINAVFGYPRDVQVHTEMPVRPPNLYGATKCWGEALARLYADQRGLSVHCIRFGGVESPESEMVTLDHPYIDLVITHRDAVSLLVASVEAPSDIHFGLFHGLSDNRYKRLDISDTKAILNWQPVDDSFMIAEANVIAEAKERAGDQS